MTTMHAKHLDIKLAGIGAGHCMTQVSLHNLRLLETELGGVKRQCCLESSGERSPTALWCVPTLLRKAACMALCAPVREN